MRGRPAGQHRHRQIRGRAARASSGSRLLLPGGVRGAGRHEPRRPAAPLRGRGPRAGLRPGGGRRPPREAAAAPAAEAGLLKRALGALAAPGAAGTPRHDDASAGHTPKHPARRTPGPTRRGRRGSRRSTSRGTSTPWSVRLGPRAVRLTNLRKPFWPELGITKGDLIQYYADVSAWLLPHVRDRAMVMKRYPHGAAGEFFFMKRAPSPRPDWIELCSIEHASGNVIDFPMIQDLPSLLWVINLGCIDLNQWYARCDDVDRPDYLHFDLDPVKGKTPVPFDTGPGGRAAGAGRPAGPGDARLREDHRLARASTCTSRSCAGPRRRTCGRSPSGWPGAWRRCIPPLSPPSTGSRRRPEGRVLVDYNQNAWGRTLASIYSVRPHPRAAVSTPVTWEEVESGIGDRGLPPPERARPAGRAGRPLEAAPPEPRPGAPRALRVALTAR